jgi:2'-5' RNA ligase
MARLFVAVWPPADVMERLAALPRREQPGVRWTTRDQWHVTLRFLGEADVDAARGALAGLQAASCHAVLGSRARRLGPSAFVVPVGGLDELAAGVALATEGVGQSSPRPSSRFRGHLTLARLKGKARPGLDVSALASASWWVTSVALVQSQLHPHGARYETLAEVALAPAVRSDP